MESEFEYGGGPAPTGGSKKYTASSGRYHGGSEGKFQGNGVKPSGGYKSHSYISPEKRPYYAHRGSSSGKGSSSYHSKGSYTSNKKKGLPAYIDESGAVFDAFYNHIPTQKVPYFHKGSGWTPEGLISFGSKRPYGSYSDNVYDNPFDEFEITGSIGSGGYHGGYKTDLNPYKDMLEEMNKLREENLNLGKKALSDEAGDYYRAAYIDHAKNMNSLAERLFASGSTGGMTESALAYIDASYKNAIRDIEKEKLKNIGLLQSQYAEGKAKDHAMTMDKVMRHIENERSERRAYERLLEERRYRERQEEREFRRKIIEKYYGL